MLLEGETEISGIGIIMLIMFVAAIGLMLYGCTDLEVVKKVLSKTETTRIGVAEMLCNEPSLVLSRRAWLRC